jgi:hypothetical protein
MPGARAYQLPPDEPPPPPPEKPPPLLNPLDPEEPGVETKVPAATVENESMLDATSEKPPVDQLPTYQAGLASECPAALAAAATSSKTRAQRSARPKTMA